MIVVGAGLAGMMAAYHAAREGAEVLLLDRGSVGLGTNSAMANGVFAGPTTSLGEGEYVRGTMEIGRMLNKQGSVALIAREARSSIRSLASFGLTVTEGPGSYSVRSPSPGVIPGVTMVKGVRDRVLSLDRVKAITGFFVTGFLREDDRVTGVAGFDRKGVPCSLPADSVVLASGGAGAAYLKHDNQKGILGHGYVLAARAGLPLLDMEFLQFYPLVVAGAHLPSMILYPPLPEEAMLRGPSGEDLLTLHNLGNINQAIMTGRDRFSLILHRELEKGPVTVDFTAVPEDAWREHPMAILGRLHFDFRRQPLPVSPAVHFCMGGIEVDDRCETALKGLFACGEVLWGLHGANRRGGNALTECVVTGAIAGREAASQVPRSLGTAREGTPGTGTGADSMGRFRETLRHIRSIAWEWAGLVRNGEGMAKGVDRLQEVENDLDRIRVDHPRALVALEDCRAAAFTVRAILTAGIPRHETRGAFIRSDFPEEDNLAWKKNSCLFYDPETKAFSVTYRETR